MPPPRCALTDEMHRRQHGLRRVQRAAQAHVEHRVVVPRGDVQRLARLRDAGVVDEDVDAPEPLADLGRGDLARGLVGHVGHQANVPFAQLSSSRAGLGAGQVQDDDACAVRGHLSGSGETEAVESGAAGDHRDLVLEQHLRVSRVC
jgi:hypothetical protein